MIPAVARSRGSSLLQVSALVVFVAACADRTPLAPSPAPPPSYGASSSPCDPAYENALQDCVDEPGYGTGYHPPPVGYDIGMDWMACLTPGTDVDIDGMDDNCEHQLAVAFAPGLQVDGSECNWDGALGRVGGEYYYGVQLINPGNGSRVRIVYLPAYYKDCGYTFDAHLDSHEGDSEFIIVDLGFRALTSAEQPTWQFLQAFLSAHCGAEFLGLEVGSECQWWDAGYWEREGRWVDSRRYGAPVVWVASGKHSNYYSKEHCSASETKLQSWARGCSTNGTFRRFPVVGSWQNIGSIRNPLVNVTGPRWGSQHASMARTEAFWNEFEKFYGWQDSRSGGSTAIGEILASYALFYGPGTAFPAPGDKCTPTETQLRPC